MAYFSLIQIERVFNTYTFEFYREPTPQDSEEIDIKWFPYICDRKFCLNISDSLIPIEDFEEESWKIWKPVLDKHKPF